MSGHVERKIVYSHPEGLSRRNPIERVGVTRPTLAARKAKRRKQRKAARSK